MMLDIFNNKPEDHVSRPALTLQLAFMLKYLET